MDFLEDEYLISSEVEDFNKQELRFLWQVDQRHGRGKNANGIGGKLSSKDVTGSDYSTMMDADISKNQVNYSATKYIKP
eukprot:CAMPEP_0194075986 /NCGR_PEP_ID=MMETSP0149-20130528/2866_1 /TAXON_ID=122233 /ORGANISM="Chaetoceros debilis, Strain MM31A-1" /LENGTH=78 /DNA_ID=CAMNT_0038756605 /DNA_START=109 /DNA_END=345 /DNA_ORIENTATION=+